MARLSRAKIISPEVSTSSYSFDCQPKSDPLKMIINRKNSRNAKIKYLEKLLIEKNVNIIWETEKTNRLTCKSLAWTKFSVTVTVTVWLEQNKARTERHSKPLGTSANKTGHHLSFSCEIFEVKNYFNKYRIIMIRMIRKSWVYWIQYLAFGLLSLVNLHWDCSSIHRVRVSSIEKGTLRVAVFSFPANNEQLLCDKWFAKCQC